MGFIMQNNLLKKFIIESIICELIAGAPKPGAEKVDIKGNLDINKISNTLNVNPQDLSKAIAAAKQGTRSTSHNATLADIFVKLLNAEPQETATVMSVLKNVQKKDVKKKKKKIVPDSGKDSTQKAAPKGGEDKNKNDLLSF
jgi:hypothetical protein